MSYHWEQTSQAVLAYTEAGAVAGPRVVMRVDPNREEDFLRGGLPLIAQSFWDQANPSPSPHAASAMAKGVEGIEAELRVAWPVRVLTPPREAQIIRVK